MFHYKNHSAFCENVPLEDLSQTFGTPLFVYSKQILHENCHLLREAFKDYPTSICFSVKANSNLSLLGDFKSFGFGADIVSLGELERASLKGFNPIVFSGVGKTKLEIENALKKNIYSFNVESEAELHRIQSVAEKLKTIAPISFRINPNIDAKTFPYIATGLYTTKFGISENTLFRLLKDIRILKNINLIGLSCHIGSQMLDLSPLKDASLRMAELSHEVLKMGFSIKSINLGGGLGISYGEESPPSFKLYAETLIHAVKSTGLKLFIEPGRALVGNTGVLLTRVIEIKKTEEKLFIIVDCGMNDLIRPSLYDAYHEVSRSTTTPTKEVQADIVGPICESGDFIALNRTLQLPNEGETLFIRSAGAYGMSMSSNYNSRPRASEVLIDGDTITVIKQRESLNSLWENEL